MHAFPYRPAALCAPGLLALSLIAFTARAAESTQLPGVVVTAARSAQALANTLADVRVIDAQAIRDAGASTLAEVLRLHGGVEIASNGGPGQVSSIFMRGSNANHVVLLIDGVRINSATAGLNAWENIALAQIERIEIVRGAASSLYGADAIGGVIQIFTRNGARTEARVGVGSWRGREASVGLGREFGASRLSLQAAYGESRAFSATNQGNALSFNADDDPYRNTNLGVALEHEWASGQSVVGRLLHSQGSTSFDCGPGNDDVNRQRLATFSLESRNRLAAGWRSALRMARGTDDSAITGNCAGLFRTDHDQLSWQNDIDALGGLAVTGAEMRRERVGSDTAYNQTSRNVAAVFGAYSATLNSHLWQSALRVDDNSQFGAHTTGNLAYGYRFTPQWRGSVGVGNAFKAPSFNDLYYPSSFGFSGNPQLKSERSRSAEVAANFDNGALQGALVLFENRVHDLIAIDPTFSTVINVNRARIYGATLSAAVVQTPWVARGEVTRQEATDSETGNRLARRARQHGSASVTATPGPWRMGLEWLISGARFDVASNTSGSRMGGYSVFNVHAAYAITPHVSVLARLNNAGDRRYELAQGYNTPSRNVFVALQYAAP
ncbi:MAG: TonB-dependent receptor [Burkholderiaceae bacterium]